MYLWNTDALIKDFQNDQVNSAEKFKYYLVSSLYVAFITNFSLINIGDSSEAQEYQLLFTLITLVINGIGCYANYRLNQHGDDTDFIKRCICLSIPIAIKINTIGSIAFMLLIWLFSDDMVEFSNFFNYLDESTNISNDNPDNSEEISATMTTTLGYLLIIWPSTILFYYLLARKLEAIAYYTPPVFETSHDSN